MFILISYLWLVFILAVLIAPIVVGLMSRPKKIQATNEEPQVEGLEEAPTQEAAPELGDELAEMELK